MEHTDENYFILLELKKHIESGKYDTINPKDLDRIKSSVNVAYTREVRRTQKEIREYEKTKQ